MRLFPALCLVVVLMRGTVAWAAIGRHAIIIGDNRGDASDVELRYAESDARRVATVLRTVGGFYPENITLLTNVTADDLRRVLIALNERLRQSSDETLLFVFYSGHADAEALHAARSHFSIGELRSLVAGSPADARVLVVDSCRSGTLTRVKGGHRAPSFDVHASLPQVAKGLAILTSSAAGEDSQESDELRASFFTHHLVSALLGAADRDRDGRITIDEAFAYAAARTLAATVITAAGAQHPTYRLELGGRDDLVLTEPGPEHGRRDIGALEFPHGGSYAVQAGGATGNIVAELVTESPGGRLSLDAGRYFVTERAPEYLMQGTFVIEPGQLTVIDVGKLRRIEYARVVRKGAGPRAHALSAFAETGVRGDILGLGVAARADVGARLDLPRLSLELRLGWSESRHGNARLAIASHELAGSLAGLHAFDFSVLTFAIGLELGGSWLGQLFNDSFTRPRNSFGFFLAPVAQLEIPVYRRLYARVDAALLTFFLPVAAQNGIGTVVTYRANAGLGVYF
jgi:hypothetical protein